VIPLTIYWSSWEKEKGLYRDRDRGGMLRLNLKKGCKAWDRRGRDFGRVSLFSCLIMEWDPKNHFYMKKYGYLVWGRATMGKMVGKPSIGRKLR
jgi:hypothetical protein